MDVPVHPLGAMVRHKHARTDPLQPAAFILSSADLPGNLCKKLTLPHGFAIKLGKTPCFIPILFARYLKRIALSAISNAEVYARAVSRTPGPVSVSRREHSLKVDLKELFKLTMTLKWYSELHTLVE